MKSGSSAPHNELRRRVIERQFKHKKHVLTVDGNIFNYLSKNVYFRYSIDGVFANTGYYFDDMIDPGRWNNISKNTGCILKPWRKTGDHVLILMQKNSGWTMKGEHNLSWCLNTINKIKEYTDRRIVVRIPVFIMDLDHKRSPAYDVGNTRLDMLEDPSMIDRTQWIQKISMSHYNIQDIKDGILWNEVLRYFKKLGKI